MPALVDRGENEINQSFTHEAKSWRGKMLTDQDIDLITTPPPNTGIHSLHTPGKARQPHWAELSPGWPSSGAVCVGEPRIEQQLQLASAFPNRLGIPPALDTKLPIWQQGCDIVLQIRLLVPYLLSRVGVLSSSSPSVSGIVCLHALFAASGRCRGQDTTSFDAHVELRGRLQR